MLSALGRVPEEIVLWVVEIGTVSSAASVSPEVAAAIPLLQQRMLTELAAQRRIGEVVRTPDASAE
jgi:hypothetical protein